MGQKGDWSANDRLWLMTDALAQFDTDGVFLPPKVREALTARRAAMGADAPGAAPTAT